MRHIYTQHTYLFGKSGPKNKKMTVQAVIWCLKLVTKIFGKSRNIKQHWTRPEKFDICFYIGFECYCQKLIFVGETGY